MSDTLEVKPFEDTLLADSFFDSLKQDYKDFPNWFRGKIKAQEKAYVQRTDGQLTGFMYLKLEDGEVSDVDPQMKPTRRLKIGTLKVEAHGTKLGERLMKKAFDRAIVDKVQEIYITAFPKHTALINMLQTLGFAHYGEKRTSDGAEKVFVKPMQHDKLTGNIRKDYPLINTHDVKFYMLGIYPKWHSQLFPDSILKTENYDILSDITHTNSISKTYISWMSDVKNLKHGDIIVIYRTKEEGRSAEYSSVATSICTVEEIRVRSSFSDMNEYCAYAEPFSVFNKKELEEWWSHKNLTVIKLLYNAALTKRIIRKTLMDTVGLDREAYAGFMELTKNQFLKIAEIGGVNDSLIIR